jgi:hypothetical protein
MATTNVYNFAVNHHEAALLVRTNGKKVSYVFEGEPGVGKSSILKSLKEMMGTSDYDFIYVDVPLKDIPDIALSMPDHEAKVTRAFINEIWLGTDPKKPKVILLDEVFKGTDFVKLMMNRLLLEQMVGDYKLPEGSIVFGTTNFATDGVGDRTNAHSNSRVVRVPMRKPIGEEWQAWAIDNNIHPLVTTWAKQNPAIFNSYKDTEFDARAHKDGQGVFHYIFHPQHNNQQYVCPRTLELASHQIYSMDDTGEALMTKALIGTVGAKAALDMSAMFALGADLPTLDDIVQQPENARVPRSAPAQLMLVFKSLQYIADDNVDAFATYFQRLPKEVMSTWIKTIVSTDKVKGVALKNQQIKSFAISNSWIL